MPSLQLVPRPPIDEVIAFIGNSERKAALQLVVDPGELATEVMLRERVDSLREQTDARQYISPHNIALMISSCHRLAGSFAAPPAVGGRVDLDTWQAYKAPDSDVPDAVAGYALGIAVLAAVNLQSIFGQTSTHSPTAVRAPRARLRIFGELAGLAAGQTVGVSELAGKIAMSTGMASTHVHSLRDANLLEISDEDRRTATFRLIGDPRPLQARAHRTTRPTILAQVVRLYTKGATTFTFDDIRAGMTASGTALKNAMRKLAEHGIVERLNTPRGKGVVLTELALTDRQREVAAMITDAWRGLEAGSTATITRGIELAEQITGDPPLITQLLQREHEMTRTMSYAARCEQIFAIFGPGESCTTRQLQERLRQHGIPLSLDRTLRLLQHMSTDELVTMEVAGNDKLWCRPPAAGG